jgi:hypothetical protein
LVGAPQSSVAVAEATGAAILVTRNSGVRHGDDRETRGHFFEGVGKGRPHGGAAEGGTGKDAGTIVLATTDTQLCEAGVDRARAGAVWAG